MKWDKYCTVTLCEAVILFHRVREGEYLRGHLFECVCPEGHLSGGGRLSGHLVEGPTAAC